MKSYQEFLDKQESILNEYREMILKYECDHGVVPDLIAISHEEWISLMRNTQTPFDFKNKTFLGVELLVVDSQKERKFAIHSRDIKNLLDKEFSFDIIKIAYSKNTYSWASKESCDPIKPVKMEFFEIHKDLISAYKKGR